MEIFKFGGASVKDADSIKNMISVLRKADVSNLIIVVSAMGKTTNALEALVHSYINSTDDLQTHIENLRMYHVDIISSLFETKEEPVFDKVDSLFADLELTIKRNKSTHYDFIYDQLVGYGELLSTTIISEYLKVCGYSNTWTDARELIKTSNNYRVAEVDWEDSKRNIQAKMDEKGIYITQGFIGSDYHNFTTTLGREGSDYTAAIIAYCLNATSVTIWKDVPGVLNADPRIFENTQLLSEISYKEAIELAFYGASVIHPKTLQPLQTKEIPLYVKSFLSPEATGTVVRKGLAITPNVPCYIVKKNQILISLSSLDFSFIVERNISDIFTLFNQYQIKVTLIQNSAISFSVCVEDIFNSFATLLQELKSKFRVVYSTDVSLFTIRHFTEEAIQNAEKGKEVLLTQTTRETYQMVSKD